MCSFVKMLNDEHYKTLKLFYILKLFGKKTKQNYASHICHL